MADIRLVLPNPYPLEWYDWRDTVIGINPVLAGTSNLDALEWQEFADRLSQFIDAPYGEDFETWQEWVLALRSSLSL